LAKLNVICSVCAISGEVLYGPYPGVYQMAGGETVPISSAIAWCAGCSTVVEAEQLPPRSDIERDLADVEAHGLNATALSGFGDDERLVALHVASLRSRLAWRDLRRAPARCLRCGSTELEFLPHDEDRDDWPSMRHPGCAGTLKLTFRAFVRLALGQPPFSVDGERLADSPTR
jgi:hypothetical protein